MASVQEIKDTLEGLRKKVISSVDWGIKNVSTTVSTTAVSAQDEANKLMDKSKARWLVLTMKSTSHARLTTGTVHHGVR